MKKVDANLGRLLRSAAIARDDVPVEAPFGFETRVVALWRTASPNGTKGMARLLRHMAIVAIALIVVSSAGVVYELSLEPTSDESFTNAYAIADSAIETEVP